MTAETASAAPFVAAPSATDLARNLEEAGEIILQSFSELELGAVGAGSPVRGLVATPEFLQLDDPALLALLRIGADSLAARGLLRDGEGSHVLDLGGDLAAVVAIRSRPALVGIVSVAPGSASPDSQPAARIVGVLHGFAVQETRLAGFLEETITRAPLHEFCLCTPERMAERILAAHRDLSDTWQGPTAIYVDFYVPGPVPRHLRLALDDERREADVGGVVAYRSSAPGPWTDILPLHDQPESWTELFVRSVSTPS